MPAKGWTRDAAGVYQPPPRLQPVVAEAEPERKERRYKRLQFLHGKALPTREGRRW